MRISLKYEDKSVGNLKNFQIKGGLNRKEKGEGGNFRKIFQKYKMGEILACYQMLIKVAQI